MSASKRQRTNPEEQSGGKRNSKGLGKGGGKGASIKVESQVEMSSATRAGPMKWIKSNKPWHECTKCDYLCTRNLTYRYMYQTVCSKFSTNWLHRKEAVIPDWLLTVIGRSEDPQDIQQKDRMAVIHSLSGDVPEATVLEKIKQIGKKHNIFVDLESRPVVQKIIRDIHETLRTIVKDNTDLFQENGNFTSCSIQLHPTKDKVLDVRYYLLHAVFQIQMINSHPQMFKWWVSALDETSAQFGIQAMRLKFQSVVDEYLQQIVGEDQLREDSKGKVWRYFIGREPEEQPHASTTSTAGEDKQDYEEVSSR